MVPAEGLNPPEPRVPRTEEPLWLEGQGGQAKDDDAQLRPRKRHKFDENRTIKKKFKVQPTTLNEQRECKMVCVWGGRARGGAPCLCPAGALLAGVPRGTGAGGILKGYIGGYEARVEAQVQRRGGPIVRVLCVDDLCPITLYVG